MVFGFCFKWFDLRMFSNVSANLSCVLSLEKRVKEIMHKAFWDCLESQLNEDPPSYSHAITLVGEIKEVKKRIQIYSLSYYDIAYYLNL